MVRYPHSITVSWSGAPVKDEATGDYTPGVSDSFTIPCSISNNSDGQKIGSDGKMVDYSYHVNMVKQTKQAPFGAPAVITLDNGTQVKDTVKLMRNFQTHSEIWL